MKQKHERSGTRRSARNRGVRGLDRYHRKRDFQRTPEPAGRVHAQDGFSFVIQKHHASRLHYDFRLELDGVLKSWAVPKGPSLNPSDRRLAVHVEDHPIEYGGFEGVIPQGQYGGGKVILWDRGRWIPEGDPHQGYRKGHLKFRLEGVKLAGSWSLIRIRDRKTGDDKNWLLIKGKDAHAGTRDVTVEQPGSVAGDVRPPRVWESDRASRTSTRARRRPVRPSKRRDAMPSALEPELATLVDRPPEGEEWVHEVKYDGYRLLCRVEGSDVTLSTRHGKNWTDSFPTLARAALRLPVKEALLDGELVVMDERGISSFQALQNALGKGREKEIVYCAFDLLYLDGRDLRRLPLLERKAILEKLLRKAPRVFRYSEHIAGSGPTLYKRSCDLCLEGLVSKRADAAYQSGRSGDWLKSKCLGRQEFVIAGFTEPEGKRSGFGSLVLAVHQKDGKLSYAGKVGTGFTQQTLTDLRARLESLRRKTSPLDHAPGGPSLRGVTWVEPRLVAEVAFTGWTDQAVLRHPRFEGLRQDKPAAEVVRETPETEKPVGGQGAIAGVQLTHRDRVLYPDRGTTKGDLARYYEKISGWILPHVVGRPLSVVRCPDGQGKACFYQKHAPAGAAKGIVGVRIPEGTGTAKGAASFLSVDGLPGLISLVQMGALELHPWGARIESLERPDRMTIDLDPGPGVPWERMIETARTLRARLRDLGLESFVKTTGGKGLHVVVPLLPRQSWEELKSFSRAVSEEFVTAAPHWFVTTMTKSKRVGKIFLDFFRNTRGATAVAAYSSRSREGAPVATPVTWEELEQLRAGNSFNVDSVPERLLQATQDPWKGFFDVQQSITASMRRSVRAPSAKDGS